MDNIDFAHAKGKNDFYFYFSSVYAFKQAKEHILFQAQT